MRMLITGKLPILVTALQRRAFFCRESPKYDDSVKYRQRSTRVNSIPFPPDILNQLFKLDVLAERFYTVLVRMCLFSSLALSAKSL